MLFPMKSVNLNIRILQGSILPISLQELAHFNGNVKIKCLLFNMLHNLPWIHFYVLLLKEWNVLCETHSWAPLIETYQPTVGLWIVVGCFTITDCKQLCNLQQHRVFPLHAAVYWFKVLCMLNCLFRYLIIISSTSKWLQNKILNFVATYSALSWIVYK